MTDPVITSGKRKESVARARAVPGEGRVRVNSRPIEIWQPELAQSKMKEPIILASDAIGEIDIDVTVEGGGIMGQADAVRTAIARAIVDFTGSEEIEEVFTEYDRSLLVNDPRRKEPKHPLGRGARAKKQKSYR